MTSRRRRHRPARLCAPPESYDLPQTGPHRPDAPALWPILAALSIGILSGLIISRLL